MMTRHLLAPFAFALALAAAAPASAKDVDGTLAWLPDGTTTVVVFDLEGARATPFFKDVQKQIIDLAGVGKDLAAMKREGLDVMASVKTMAYAGPDEMVRKAGRSLVVLEGDFDQAKIKSYYEKKSKAALTEKASPAGAWFAVGADKGIAFQGTFAVYGDAGLVEKALAAKKANKPKLPELVTKMKSGKHAFGVISGSESLKKILGKDFGDLKDVKQAGMTLDFSGGLKVSIVGNFPDAAKASAVAKAIKSRLTEVAADPELKEIGLDGALAKVVAVSVGTEVKVDLNLDGAAAQAFAKSLKDLF